MTNFITIDDREWNVAAIMNFGIVEDEKTGADILEITLLTGDTFEYTDDEAEALYGQLMAVKAAGVAEASRLSTMISLLEERVAALHAAEGATI